jgi:hypothetical protein
MAPPDAATPADLCDSECSTPFVSAPSSPTRDHHHHAACFYSAPASPTRAGTGVGGGIDFDFDFSSRFPSPSAAAMSSADELFCNGQIRLAAALLQPQPPAPRPFAADDAAFDAGVDPRGRVRSRSVRDRKARSVSPFRSHWRRSPSPAPAATGPEHSSDEPATAVPPAASRSSSSSSTASSASSSSRGSRRWGFLKDLLHRSKSDGGKTQHHPAAAPSPPAPKRSPSPSPAPATAPGGARRRRSAHERLYEARRAEAEEMRRRTYLPYRQGLLLFGCIGIGSHRAVHGLARGLNAATASSSSSSRS